VDAWSEYQADSIKKYEAQNLAVPLAHTGGTPQEIQAAQDEAARRQAQQDSLQPVECTLFTRPVSRSTFPGPGQRVCGLELGGRTIAEARV